MKKVLLGLVFLSSFGVESVLGMSGSSLALQGTVQATSDKGAALKTRIMD